MCEATVVSRAARMRSSSTLYIQSALTLHHLPEITPITVLWRATPLIVYGQRGERGDFDQNLFGVQSLSLCMA